LFGATRTRASSFLSCYLLLQIVHKTLDYSRKMAKFANDDDLIPGLGLPSIHGGAWDVDSKCGNCAVASVAHTTVNQLWFLCLCLVALVAQCSQPGGTGSSPGP
jgi:hypothetical protein